jgi:hypothetical protein
MNLAPAEPVELIGLCLHVVSMALVTVFAVAMLTIYLSGMRRAAALIDRLTSTPPRRRALPHPASPVLPIPMRRLDLDAVPRLASSNRAR